MQQLPGVFSEEAALRARQDLLDIAISNAFSFQIFMYFGFTFFHIIANLIITVPCLSFYDERKSGFTRILASKTCMHRYITCEALAVSISAWLIALVPALLFWALTLLLSPVILPLNQYFASAPDDYFQLIDFRTEIQWLYLRLILITSAGFFFKGLLTFVTSLVIDKKVTLIFLPLLYSYAVYALFEAVGLNGYAELSYFDGNIKSVSPVLFSFAVSLAVSTVIIYTFCNREKMLNG